MLRQDRRQQIMQAAEDLFENRQFHEITLDEVAARARVGKGTIYRHFADKDDLFFQTATSGFDDLCLLLRQAVPGDAPFEARLLAACEQVTGFFNRRRRLLRLMEVEQGRIEPGRSLLRELWQVKRQGLVKAVAAILKQGQQSGRVRRDLPGEVAAAYLLGMLRTRARDLVDAPASHRRLELILDLFLNGSARPPAARVNGSSQL
jgi:TetR/AcrR family fatty acid metabolism transcriptional regulator